MRAQDIMTTCVVTVTEDTSISEIASLLDKFHISAVPVVDDNNRLVGMVDEAVMNHHHRKILHSLFAHPINANIGMKDV